MQQLPYCTLLFTQDMQMSGAPLRKICQAGPWRSGAIFKYLDECELEADVALEAALSLYQYVVIHQIESVFTQHYMMNPSAKIE